MKKIEMNQMEMVEGGKEQISCERAMGWLFGAGTVIAFIPGLFPLGIVLAAAGAGTATTC
ncbi:hypothetical protein [Niabella aquatica]